MNHKMDVLYFKFKISAVLFSAVFLRKKYKYFNIKFENNRYKIINMVSLLLGYTIFNGFIS